MVQHRKYQIFTYYLYLGVKVTQNVAQYLLHSVTNAPVKLFVAMSKCIYKKLHYMTKCCPIPFKSNDQCICKIWSCYVQQFRRRLHVQECTLYDLDLGVKVIQGVAQYPPHHVTYAPAKVEVAMPKI